MDRGDGGQAVRRRGDGPWGRGPGRDREGRQTWGQGTAVRGRGTGTRGGRLTDCSPEARGLGPTCPHCAGDTSSCKTGTRGHLEPWVGGDDTGSIRLPQQAGEATALVRACPGATEPKPHSLGGVASRHFLSLSWRPEVRGHGVGRVRSRRGPWGRVRPRPLSATPGARRPSPPPRLSAFPCAVLCPRASVPDSSASTRTPARGTTP